MEPKPLAPNLQAALDFIRNLPVDVEQVGDWLWVDSTIDSKDMLKAAGFRWSSRKQRWYMVGSTPPGHAEHKLSAQETRDKHGSSWLIRNLSQT
jgi:hypothetical protein